MLPNKANTHGAAADLVEYHLGRELIRPSGTAAGVEEASLSRNLLFALGFIEPYTLSSSTGYTTLRRPQVSRHTHQPLLAFNTIDVI